MIRSNPPGLHTPPGYHHVTVAGGFAFLAGQCPLDQAGALAGPDLPVQVDQVVHNISVALSSVGASPSDVVRTVIYVVSSDREELSLVWSLLGSSAIAAAFTSASTLLGVAQLGFPGQLVEIDVTAVSSLSTSDSSV